MTYEQAYMLPFGELCDLIAVEQIKVEGADKKRTRQEEEDAFWELMAWQ